MFGFLQDWVRSHWKAAIALTVGYWITYAVVCILTGTPMAFPMFSLTMMKPAGVV